MNSYLEGLNLVAIFSLAFLAITFLQSGWDKVADYKGNLEFIKGYFEKTPVSSISPVLFMILTVVELFAGVCSAIGIIQLLMSGNSDIGLLGAVASAKAIVMLLVGNRLAKDYPAAANLAGYFIIALIAIYSLT